MHADTASSDADAVGCSAPHAHTAERRGAAQDMLEVGMASFVIDEHARHGSVHTYSAACAAGDCNRDLKGGDWSERQRWKWHPEKDGGCSTAGRPGRRGAAAACMRSRRAGTALNEHCKVAGAKPEQLVFHGLQCLQHQCSAPTASDGTRRA